MNYKEYGADNTEVIILLHGGGLSWWNYKEVAEKLATNYRIILPILDGHFESSNDFTSINDNAERIIELIDVKFNGSVLLIGGLSLGAQILLEILSKRKNICEYAVVESALVIPSKLTDLLIEPVFGSFYSFIKNKAFSKLQFKSLKIKETYFDDYYKDTVGITKRNMISFLKANSIYIMKDSLKDTTAKVHIFVGGKELNKMKRSANLIHRKIKTSELQVLSKLHHGEFSINYSTEYTEKIIEIINN